AAADVESTAPIASPAMQSDQVHLISMRQIQCLPRASQAQESSVAVCADPTGRGKVEKFNASHRRSESPYVAAQGESSGHRPGGAQGSSTQNVEPLPAWLSNAMVPPCASTSSRAIHRPSPKPP